MEKEKKMSLGRAVELYAMKTESCGYDEKTGATSGLVLVSEMEKDGIICTGNGSKIRAGDYLNKKYIIEKVYNGKAVYAYKFKGFKKEETFRQSINPAIVKELYEEFDKRSVLSGMPGTPSNPIEVDHKAGIKNDMRLNKLNQQRKGDFQLLLKNENDAKRQDCNVCKKTFIRPPASKVLPVGAYMGIDYTTGDEHLNMELQNPCLGCVWHDVRDCMEKQRTNSKIKN